MPSITYDKFDVGLDRRKNITVADANRLYNLQNAYITKGKVIRKRSGLVRDNTLEAGTIGLISGGGKLNTFYESGTITHANTNYKPNRIAKSGSDAKQIHFGDIFSGFLYVVVEYNDGTITHHYLDGTVITAGSFIVGKTYVIATVGTTDFTLIGASANTVGVAFVATGVGAGTGTAGLTMITDANCPQTKQTIKAAEKIWAMGVAKDTVRFTKSSTPRDWTTASDAGFIPTGLRATGSADGLSLGKFQEFLTVGFSDAVQLWNISAVYSAISYYKPVDGLPCPFQQSIKQFGGDQVFLSTSGFRSIQQQAYTNNLNEIDIGSPVDDLVKPYIVDGIIPLAALFLKQGQYWCLVNSGSNIFFVFTLSRSVKVAAWSIYILPFVVNAIAPHNGKLYLRSVNNVYVADETDTIFDDDGVAYEMRAEFPFLNFQTPGITKYIASMDVVVDGTVDVQFRYDPNDLTKITDPITVTGDGRAKQSVPVEITVPEIAPIFVSNSTSKVQIDAFTFYFDNLGPGG